MKDYLITVKINNNFTCVTVKARNFAEAEDLAVLKPGVIEILQIILIS